MSHGTRRADRTFAVDGLARVEGEGSFRAVVRDGVVADVELTIFEPPRFFEALLRGRDRLEPPDITARICGICPVAYQMSACRAIEDAYGLRVGAEIAALRRLLYCGEWIQSHALHVALLHAPDFLGCADAVELAQLDRPAVERGLRLKRIGNMVMETVGGRSVHPVNVRVGGFYKAPSPEQIAALAEPLREARDLALATVEWTAGFDFPDVEADYLFVALHDPERYAIDSGRICSTAGLDTDAAGFLAAIVEEHVERSTALQSRLFGRDDYLTGPLARYALNREQLGAPARGAADAAGLGASCRNPFRSIVVRSVELVEACDQALRIVESYGAPHPPAVDVPVAAGTGTGATEAPRGLLLHRYEIGADGLITSAQIVPPTAQNQLSIEADLRRVVELGLDLPDDDLTWRCEQAVRNHDPCISCAAHFLDVEVVRR